MTWEEASERRILELRELASSYAKAKSQAEHIREFRKTKKAQLMVRAEQSGVRAVAAQERDAYAHPEYVALLEGLREAVEAEERLRWDLELHRWQFEAWRTRQSTKRAEMNLR